MVEVAFYIYLGNSLTTIADVSQGEVLAPDNLRNEKENLKTNKTLPS